MSGSRRGEQQRRELEGSAVPAVKPGEALHDFRIGAVVLDIGEDTLEGWLCLLEGRQDLASKQGDEGGGQRGGRLPAFASGPLLLDRQDHLLPPEELKSLTNRALTHSKSALDVVEINGTWGNVKERVDLGN